MNDPTAQMASQIGKSAMMSGQHYVEQNVRMSSYRRREEADKTLVQSIRVCLRLEALLQRL